MNPIGSALLASAAAMTLSSEAAASLRSDLRDYALAACLTRQTASPSLATEGYRLADVVLARAGASPLAWKSLDAAVAGELKRRGLLMIHVDGPVAQATQPAPLASCLLVIDGPPVQAATRNLTRTKRR